MRRNIYDHRIFHRQFLPMLSLLQTFELFCPENFMMKNENQQNKCKKVLHGSRFPDDPYLSMCGRWLAT